MAVRARTGVSPSSVHLRLSGVDEVIVDLAMELPPCGLRSSQWVPRSTERAAEIDLGFDPLVVAEMMRTIDRFSDDDLPVDEADVVAVPELYGQSAEEIEHSSGE